MNTESILAMLHSIGGVPEPNPDPEPPFRKGPKATNKRRVKLPKAELKRRSSQSKRDRRKGGR